MADAFISPPLVAEMEVRLKHALSMLAEVGGRTQYMFLDSAEADINAVLDMLAGREEGADDPEKPPAPNPAP